MASKMQICNIALMRLGEPVLGNLDENNKRAIALRNCYDLARDTMIQDHPWNFAMTRASLARLEEAPDFGYTYAYQLPTGCLQVHGLVGDGENVDLSLAYKVEGQHLLTNESSARILYTARIEETGTYPPRFCSALAAYLAYEISYYISKSPALREQMFKEYQKELMAAKGLDGQEGTPEVYESNPWDEARA